MVLVLNESEVAELLSMDAALETIELAFRELGEGGAFNQPRNRIRTPNGTLQVMSSYVPGAQALGLKYYAAYRTGARFLVSLFDSETGELQALMEANTLGQIRTGAATGVATKYLARAEAETVGMIGSGWQARSQLAAVCAVRPIRHVRVYSRDQDRRRAFAEEMERTLGLEVRPAETGREAVQGADVVIVMTNARAPVLEGAWLESGTHVNAAGSNRADAAELDVAAVKRADLVTADQVADAAIESGDLIAAVNAGAIRWDQVVELGAIVAGRVPGRTSPEQVTLFESQGLAAEDMAAARKVYELARERGVGREVPMFESGGGRPARNR